MLFICHSSKDKKQFFFSSTECQTLPEGEGWEAATITLPLLSKGDSPIETVEQYIAAFLPGYVEIRNPDPKYQRNHTLIPLTDSQKMQRSFSGFDTPNKPYWHWVCGCGFDDNRNNDQACRKCGEKLSCATGGGHSYMASPARDTVCNRGCCRV